MPRLSFSTPKVSERRRRRPSLAIAALVAVLLAAPAIGRAQNFPPDADFAPLHCGAAVMTDPYRDVAGVIDERDLVGDANAPAGYHAADVDFAYLRMRVDGDPVSGITLRPSVWGFELDIDNDPSTYEILVSASGISGQVAVFRNSATTVADSPADPADSPPVATYPFATHARTGNAPGSNFGLNGDYFVDIAVPWTVLASLGVNPQTQVRLWVGTSSRDDALDADLACQDGSTGPAHLSGTGSQSTGFAGSGGGGTGGSGGGGGGGAGGAIGPVGENGLELAGGAGCAVVPGEADAAPAGGVLAAVALGAAAAAVARGRRQRSSLRRRRANPAGAWGAPRSGQ
jgi:hypothetical protein